MKKGPVPLSSQSQRSQSEKILSSFAAPFAFKIVCEKADGVLFRVLDVEKVKLEVLFVRGVACEACVVGSSCK